MKYGGWKPLKSYVHTFILLNYFLCLKWIVEDQLEAVQLETIEEIQPDQHLQLTNPPVEIKGDISLENSSTNFLIFQITILEEIAILLNPSWL